MSENNVNLFEQASRRALRFESTRGPLSTEQLWDLPLTSKNGLNLDAVARAVNNELKAVTEESFVEKANPAKVELTLKLEVVKHIIATIQAENTAKAEKLAKREKRQRLLEALDAKESDEIKGMSKEQIREQLAALDD